MNEYKHELFDVEKINSLESLKDYGAYLPLKNYIEKKIGFKLGVKGWKDLYEKIRLIIIIFNEKKDLIDNALSKEDLSSSKSELKNILNLNISAKNKKDLNKKIDSLMSFFIKPKLSAYEKYEKNKRNNFISSSKLEGIHINPESGNKSLDQVLNKYREKFYG